jgi:hypothetical protein
LVLLALALSPGLTIADDEETAKLLKEKDCSIGLSKGVVTSVDIKDCSAWMDEDFRLLGRLSGLRNLSVGPGLTDHALSLLAELSELDTLQTNESRFSDEGLKALLPLRKLKILKFFHPGKTFTGTGLAHLAALPLERLTVAGSLAFADEGMAAACTLVNLMELRTWHAGQTLEGVKKLKNLKNLKSLTLGQRLAYKPPTTLSDDTIQVLAEMKSLESLRLEEARLKFDALVQLKLLPNLKSLTLEGIDLPETEVEKLRQALPAAKVQWTKPNETYMRRIVQLFGPQ